MKIEFRCFKLAYHDIPWSNIVCKYCEGDNSPHVPHLLKLLTGLGGGEGGEQCTVYDCVKALDPESEIIPTAMPTIFYMCIKRSVQIINYKY